MSDIVEFEVALGARSYPIVIGPGTLGRTVMAPIVGRYSGVFVVTNDIVAPLYLDRVLDALGVAPAGTLVVPDGEGQKCPETLWRLVDAMVESRLERGGVLVALGGGVIGDLAGFAAAVYQRGIDFVQVPTTLLAQVDSSVGGKTAINHPAGKNLIGAFHQPVAVVADTDTLTTLPDREYRAGLAEVVKYGVIRDAALFTWLADRVELLNARDPGTLAEAIERSCRNKAEVVAADEREAGERALLNFGHTFGHAFENLLGYGTWLHGEAVAAGMVAAAHLSVRLGRLDRGDAERLEALLLALGLPTRIPATLDPDAVWSAMLTDKKTSHGRPKLILADALGRARIEADYDDVEVRATLTDLRALATGG